MQIISSVRSKYDRENAYALTLKCPRRSPWGPTTVFAYFASIASNILTGVICNCHPYGPASFNTKTKMPRRFLANKLELA